jgi:hypothetical protein
VTDYTVVYEEADFRPVIKQTLERPFLLEEDSSAADKDIGAQIARQKIGRLDRIITAILIEEGEDAALSKLHKAPEMTADRNEVPLASEDA